MRNTNQTQQGTFIYLHIYTYIKHIYKTVTIKEREAINLRRSERVRKGLGGVEGREKLCELYLIKNKIIFT